MKSVDSKLCTSSLVGFCIFVPRNGSSLEFLLFSVLITRFPVVSLNLIINPHFQTAVQHLESST